MNLSEFSLVFLGLITIGKVPDSDKRVKQADYYTIDFAHLWKVCKNLQVKFKMATFSWLKLSLVGDHSYSLIT